MPGLLGSAPNHGIADFGYRHDKVWPRSFVKCNSLLSENTSAAPSFRASPKGLDVQAVLPFFSGQGATVLRFRRQAEMSVGSLTSIPFVANSTTAAITMLPVTVFLGLRVL